VSRTTDLVTRSARNPILTAQDVPYPVATVHNPAAARLDDGRIVMVFRSHRANGRSLLGAADSTDGERFTVRPKPWLTPSDREPFASYEEYGVEDPRLTRIDGNWYLTYSAYSRHGVRIGLARSRDLVTVERLGFITQADHRNTVLFPERIDGDYVRFDRPHTELTPWSIWLSRSPDLIHWGRSTRVHTPKTYHWTSAKVGPGAPPVRTDAGWLHIFRPARSDDEEVQQRFRCSGRVCPWVHKLNRVPNPVDLQRDRISAPHEVQPPRSELQTMRNRGRCFVMRLSEAAPSMTSWRSSPSASGMKR
jgi:predicted GH43/DUF377 family glycosyl hydrolase